jgi:hypothetical protein
MPVSAKWEGVHLALLQSPAVAPALEELDGRGGWRTLFDPDSEEWHWSSLEEKVSLLERFRQAGFGVEALLDSFTDQCECRGRLDLVRAAGRAVREIRSGLEGMRSGEAGGQRSLLEDLGLLGPGPAGEEERRG